VEPVVQVVHPVPVEYLVQMDPAEQAVRVAHLVKVVDLVQVVQVVLVELAVPVEQAV
jgi:hypothetical protein